MGAEANVGDFRKVSDKGDDTEGLLTEPLMSSQGIILTLCLGTGHERL